jgi:hypothetical protein
LWGNHSLITLEHRTINVEVHMRILLDLKELRHIGEDTTETIFHLRRYRNSGHRRLWISPGAVLVFTRYIEACLSTRCPQAS